MCESRGDAQAKVVRVPDWLRERHTLPDPYVRLIYCLAYGQTGLCDPKPIVKGPGTPGFWQIFGQLALGQNSNPDKSQDGKLRWRVEVLERLMARGIWLEDASPMGVYIPSSGQKIRVTDDDDVLRQILREGYEQHVWPGVAAKKPAAVWVIGKGVFGMLEGLTEIRNDRWIYQPEGARGNQRQVFEDQLARLVSDAAELAPESR
jgi:hypothetical protein